MFVGRDHYLRRLERELGDVRREHQGRFVLVRGRRRVGKSRLVEEFLRRCKVPSLFFTASRQAASRELALFAEALAESDLPAGQLVTSGTVMGSWDAAFNLIAASLNDQSEPAVVVIDELPYLLEGDPALEGTLQKAWDRRLRDLPVLLIVIGSDLAMMRALTEYGRPLYGRPTTIMGVKPFTPLEVASALELDAKEALDAYMVIGGLPFLARSWRSGDDLWAYLESSLVDVASPLVFDGERILSSEFPSTVHARRVLTAIGSGETTFGAIGRSAGLNATSLARALDVLVNDKGVVAVDRPLSGKAARHKRYRIADPYLRFWLAFIEPALPELERERGHVVLRRLRSRWSDYLGKAIEPLVRGSIERMLPDDRFQASMHVGSHWSRTGQQEVDLMLAREGIAPVDIEGVGSIKWRESKPFGRRDRDELMKVAAGIPGVPGKVRSIGVSGTGFRASGLDVELGPEDLVRAWEGSA